MRKKQFIFVWFAIFIASCTTQPQKADTVNFTGADDEVIIMTLDPGHFHAALVQKISYKQVDPDVYVYAPEGPDAQDHLKRIEGFNTRANNPTNWNTKLYTGDDFLEKMIAEKPGNVMVTSGNNKKKTEYISKAINAGIHVLADKPMAIDAGDFELLEETFISAEERGVLLYDIMTERYSITSILQKELSKITDVFGELLVGSPENPSITKESVHHFFKYVAGNKIKRPPWFFDVTQQGEGLVDITTHLVDLIQWECFPEVILDYQRDIEVLTAKRWPTELTPSQFESVTCLTEYPEYLKKDIVNDSVLNIYCNGKIIYKLRGIHAKVSVIWNYRAPEGGGDTHFSIMRGTKTNLVIRQGEEQNYTPELYVEPVKEVDDREFKQKLALAVEKLQEKYPGIELLKLEGKWQIIIPGEYRIGHEAHFGQVTHAFLQYLVDGKLPDWEVPNIIAKYYTTTRALELAKKEERVLVFTKNEVGGYIHDCIPASVAAIQKLGRKNGIIVDTTSNSALFTDEYLKKYSAIVFSNTNNMVFETENERVAFMRYIQAGGGFVGIHLACGTERQWHWFSQLLGGTFEWHPPYQAAVIDVIDHNHPSTGFLPDRWEREDEWYLLKNMNPDIHILATLDSATYQSERHGKDYPTAWYHEYDGGRSFYTAGGHSSEHYSDSLFIRHIFGGIVYAIGENKKLDYSKVKAQYPE